jgi:hypothetical protein
MVGNMTRWQRWYVKNRKSEIAKATARQAARGWENTLKFIEYFREHPCANCGETDPLVLDFDHDDPKAKRIEVSKMRNRNKWETILKEIEKCTVRCANCHRRRTHQQGNSLKYRVIMGLE